MPELVIHFRKPVHWANTVYIHYWDTQPSATASVWPGVPMTAAALGATLPLETLDGPREVEIARGAQSGDTVTMRGLGVTHLRQSGRGDLTIHVLVQTPTKLTSEQEALLRQLATLRGEEKPAGRMASPAEGKLFSKLRDAFKAR